MKHRRTGPADADAVIVPDPFRVALDDPSLRIIAPRGMLDGRALARKHGRVASRRRRR
jgi:hypothetical protein